MMKQPYATPGALSPPVQGARFRAMEGQLRRERADGRGFSGAVLDYFADRFVRHHLRFWTGYALEDYLCDPVQAEDAYARLWRCLLSVQEGTGTASLPVLIKSYLGRGGGATHFAFVLN